jgi:hypothetical protein
MSTPEAENLAALLDRLTDNLNILAAAVKRDDEAIRRLTAEVGRLTAAHQAAVEMSNVMHGRWIAAEAERDALRKDAARWQHVWQCVRIGQHGEYVLMPDDPTGLMEDSIARSAFLRDVDAAISGDKP